MTRYKIRRIDFWIYIVLAFIVGLTYGYLCFSTPSPPSPKAIGADTPPLLPNKQSAPTFTENNSSGGLMDRISDFQSEGQGSTPCRSNFTEMIITAYCPCEKCCGIYSDGVTASGHKIRPGDCFVAAPPWIPFGARLSIPGYAGGLLVEVLDRGGAIVGNRLDVFFGGEDGHEKALAWGVKELLVAQGESK